MSYFQLYEERRNRYKSITPGSVWKNFTGRYTVVISSVNLSKGTIEGTWESTPLKSNINWLIGNYKRIT